jgi:hypothetical protein
MEKIEIRGNETNKHTKRRSPPMFAASGKETGPCSIPDLKFGKRIFNRGTGIAQRYSAGLRVA